MSPEPVRTCVGCRTRAPKASLVRVAAPGGVPLLDRAGIVPGRGAYLHERATCLDAALKRGALARALRTGLTEDGIARLRSEMERVP